MITQTAMKGEIDGIIILSSAVTPKQIEAYCAYGPIVCCQDAGERLFSSIYINHAEAFRSAMQYLIERGHRTQWIMSACWPCPMMFR